MPPIVADTVYVPTLTDVPETAAQAPVLNVGPAVRLSRGNGTNARGPLGQDAVQDNGGTLHAAPYRREAQGPPLDRQPRSADGLTRSCGPSRERFELVTRQPDPVRHDRPREARARRAQRPRAPPGPLGARTDLLRSRYRPLVIHGSRTTPRTWQDARDGHRDRGRRAGRHGQPGRPARGAMGRETRRESEAAPRLGCHDASFAGPLVTG